MGNIKSMISGNAIDFMATVDDPYKQVVTNYYAQYSAQNPDIFYELTDMVDDDSSELAKFVQTHKLSWPLTNDDFTKSGGFLDNLTEDQAKTVSIILQSHIPKVNIRTA